MNYQKPKSLNKNFGYNDEHITSQDFIIKLFDDDNDFPVVSVIITFSTCSTYDHLFQKNKQISPPNTKIRVYQVDATKIKEFFEYFKENKYEHFNESELNIIKTLKNEITDIEKDCVLFNFECCDTLRHIKSDDLLKSLDFIVKNGYFVMFGDFSLMALIQNWRSEKSFNEVLGPCPFKQAGTCNSYMKLKFDAENLVKCNSPQLKTLGQLCKKGELNLHCMGGTIVCDEDGDVIKKTDLPYKYELLTTIIDNDTKTKGKVGHASLTYNSGTNLFVSSGHWIELQELESEIEDIDNIMQNCTEKEMINEWNSIKMRSKESTYNKSEQYQMASKMIQKSCNVNYSMKNQFTKK